MLIENHCLGPRFALVALWYLLTSRRHKTLPKFVAAMGLFRTFTCGGWTYVTSTDDHDWHDIFMISYLVATIPWTVGCLTLSPPNPRATKYRKYIATVLFTTSIPMIYFFVQHKYYRVPGGSLLAAIDNPIHLLISLSLHNLCLFRMVTNSL